MCFWLNNRSNPGVGRSKKQKLTLEVEGELKRGERRRSGGSGIIMMRELVRNHAAILNTIF